MVERLICRAEALTLDFASSMEVPPAAAVDLHRTSETVNETDFDAVLVRILLAGNGMAVSAGLNERPEIESSPPEVKVFTDSVD